jgi:hypothetical protein
MYETGRRTQSFGLAAIYVLGCLRTPNVGLAEDSQETSCQKDARYWAGRLTLDIRLAEGHQVLRLAEGHQVLAGRLTPDIDWQKDDARYWAGRKRTRSIGCQKDVRLWAGRRTPGVGLPDGCQVLAGRRTPGVYIVWKYIEYKPG